MTTNWPVKKHVDFKQFYKEDVKGFDRCSVIMYDHNNKIVENRWIINFLNHPSWTIISIKG